MAIFNRSINKAAISPQPTKAAAAGGTFYQNNNAGAQLVGQYYSYVEGTARNRAMSVPTISRARDLMASVIGCMNLKMYTEMWNGQEMEKMPLAPRTWLRRIDPSVPNNFIMSWTFDDLFFFGRAFWYITSRTADGYPASYTRLPAAMVQTLDQQGEVYFGPSKQLVFNGITLDPRDLVQFISPMQSLNSTGARAVEIALRVEESRLRASQSVLPSGYLKQTGGEPLSAQELSDLAAQFNLARTSGNNTAALNEFLEYVPTQATPDKMLMIESADYSARDLGRILGVPSYLLSVSIGAYSYQSSQQSRIDLWTYACKALADCITETLSSDNVLPRGTYVCFDTDDFLAEAYMGGDMPDDRMNETDIPQDALIEN
jgi:hypothetical protein